MKPFNRLFNIVISATCLGLAQHPLELGWLSWFCLVPLFIAIKDNQNFRSICFDILIWGFLYHLVSLYWLTDNIGVPDRYIGFITMLLANLICTLNILLIFAIWHFINILNGKKIWYALPFIWTMIDYLRSLGQISFPWASIANTQAQESFLPMLQFIELTGMFGITFWIVSLNVSLFYLYTFRVKNKILDSLSIFITPFILGFILNQSELKNIEKINFSILQPNIHIDDKNNSNMSSMINTLIIKSRGQINHNSENRLLIWPETAFDHYSDFNNEMISKNLKGSNINLITGVFEIENNDIYYNSIYYLNEKNKFNLEDAYKYRKMKMVPGAEYVPLTKVFPFLNKLALTGNFSIGEDYTLFDYSNSKFGAMICIESTYPSLSREFVNKGANFLVYVANDGWYLNPPEAQQHAKQTIFRAIETRKPILRCGNTGITWIVDSYGKILKRLKHNKEDVLTSEGIELYSNNNKTLYVLLGDWLAYISMFVSFYLVLKGLVKKYKK